MIWFGLVWFYGILAIVGYLLIIYLKMFDLVGFYGRSTIIGYLQPIHFYTYI